MKSADLILREGAHDAVEDAAVVEEDEVLFGPVVWVDELGWVGSMGDKYLVISEVGRGRDGGGDISNDSMMHPKPKETNPNAPQARYSASATYTPHPSPPSNPSPSLHPGTLPQQVPPW